MVVNTGIRVHSKCDKNGEDSVTDSPGNKLPQSWRLKGQAANQARKETEMEQNPVKGIAWRCESAPLGDL